MFQNAILWLFSAVGLPLGLTLILVAGKHATFQSAVGSGELLTLGIALAGTAGAIEMTLLPGTLLALLHRLGVIGVLIAEYVMFSLRTAVDREGQVIASFDADETRLSAWLLGFSVWLGFATMIRQTMQRERPVG